MSPKIIPITSDDFEFIEDQLDDYNIKSKPLTQPKPFVGSRYAIKDGDQIIAGIMGYSSYYRIGYLDTLWVDPRYRRQGLGRALLQQIEHDLHDYGCQVIHLETFDFQGPEFYEANGYTQFGDLYYPNADLHELYFQKTFAE
ncbi:GNAT family N-acetyltransferase [Schleiferilactobacillus harbinensis]|uniref:GNAT family N-acetyltransferase n=1 Tax=Schleiferilactobacillus harbinensis TaxID=304207 RepID=UPI0039ECDE13